MQLKRQAEGRQVREAVEARARRITREVHARVAKHARDVPLRLWDGTELGPGDRGYRLVLAHPWSLRALLVPGTDRAAGEAFVQGAFDVEGSMVAAMRDVSELRGEDLSGLARLGIAVDVLRLPRPPRDLLDVSGAVLTGTRHSLDRDRQAVRFHYDLPPDFFRLFLDARMVYSCAYFAEADGPDPLDDPQSLDRAQERKLELVCRKLRLVAGDRLLDVGCGWGALVLHAATRHGVRAVGVTLSEEQAAVARERAQRAGVADRVEIRTADYREVRGVFDAVASVGMVEHVGADQLDDYFATLWELTAPGGRLLNHGITTGRRDEVRDLSEDRDSFVGNHVFPDGALVPSGVMVRSAERAGFEVVDLEQLRPHYALTLQHWVRRIEDNAARVRDLVGDPVYRTWRAYMAGSAVGFEHGDLGVVQLLCSRGARLPRGRAWMVPEG